MTSFLPLLLIGCIISVSASPPPPPPPPTGGAIKPPINQPPAPAASEREGRNTQARSERAIPDGSRSRSRTRRQASGNIVDHLRPGGPTTTSSCAQITGVPQELRDAANIRPDGIDNFYQKHTEAYGIPILASAQVEDEALRRACYTVRFMLADHRGIRESFYLLSGRVVVLDTDEVISNLPEVTSTGSDDLFGLALGFSPPIAVTSEAHMMRGPTDPYDTQDIMMHEFAHQIDFLGASIVLPDWYNRLNQAYENAMAAGLWSGSYSADNVIEYFAEGTQYFFENKEDFPDDNYDGSSSMRQFLQTYDSALFALLQEVFPCQNTGYLRRRPYNPNCADLRESTSPSCSDYADSGYCDSYASYMYSYCLLTCDGCSLTPTTAEEDHVITMDCDPGTASFPYHLYNVPNCVDQNTDCLGLSSRDHCQTSSSYMHTNCRASCAFCNATITTSTTTTTAVQYGGNEHGAIRNGGSMPPPAK